MLIDIGFNNICNISISCFNRLNIGSFNRLNLNNINSSIFNKFINNKCVINIKEY